VVKTLVSASGIVVKTFQHCWNVTWWQLYGDMVTTGRRSQNSDPLKNVNKFGFDVWPTKNDPKTLCIPNKNKNWIVRWLAATRPGEKRGLIDNIALGWSEWLRIEELGFGLTGFIWLSLATLLALAPLFGFPVWTRPHINRFLILCTNKQCSFNELICTQVPDHWCTQTAFSCCVQISTAAYSYTVAASSAVLQACHFS
jgi:hypothetical protein